MELSYRRRIGYPAGLISLAFLPLLCFVYIYFNQNNQVALEVQYFNPEGYKNNLLRSTRYPRKSHPQKTIYLEVELNGDDINDHAKLAFAQLAIRTLVTSNDLNRGVHFHFTEGAKVWSLVYVFDICNIERAKTFCPEGNDFWVYNLPQQKNSLKLKFSQFKPFCSTRTDALPKAEPIAEMYSRKGLQRKFSVTIIQYFWPSTIMLFLMAFFKFKDFY